MEETHRETPKTLIACMNVDLQSVMMGLELLETNPGLCAKCRERSARIKALVGSAIEALEETCNEA